MSDLRLIACNYRHSKSHAAGGALCYLLFVNPGNGADRVEVLARSRSGRWIEHYEAVEDLTHFRVKTIPPDHPLHKDLRIANVAMRDGERDDELKQQALYLDGLAERTALRKNKV